MASISVFGIGYIGVVAAACLARDGHQVISVDIDQTKIDLVNRGISPIVEPGLDLLLAKVVRDGYLRATDDAQAAVLNSDISFVCVGTPSDASGTTDLSYVRLVCETLGAALAHKEHRHSVILRSTVLPGTCESNCIPILANASGKEAGQGFGFGYFPEFLREGTAIADYDTPGLVVFGALDDRTRAFLHDLNKGQSAAVQDVSLSTAEMIKYTSNAWRAAKIAFANEIGNISKSCGLDGQQVMELLCSDHKINISPKFLRPGFAFGGSCLPKDLRALRHLARAKQTPTPMLEAILSANAAQIDRAEHMVLQTKAQKVGFVGLSFKPGTDDLRESPLAILAERLQAKGRDIRVYDPAVLAQSQTAGSRARLPARLTDGLDELIATSEALVVGNFYAETVDALGAAANRIPTIDLTRLNRDRVSAGTYEGICW
jgi:GDP-mannose 6-dehydrogenase